MKSTTLCLCYLSTLLTAEDMKDITCIHVLYVMVVLVYIIAMTKLIQAGNLLKTANF